MTTVASERTRWLARRLWVYLTAVALGLAVCVWIVSATKFGWSIVAVDPFIMRELGRRWLDVGTMYLPYQLAGPYSVNVTPDLADTPALYPPAAGPLFAALYLIPLPIMLAFWWTVPIGFLAWSIRGWRPAPWSWPLLALCLAGPTVPGLFMAGGTSLWAAAAVAAACRWQWPAVLVLVKPTLAPFALLGVRSRWWWLGLAVIGALTVLGPWRDYLVVGANAADAGGLAYSLGSFPLVLLPLIAWWARTDGERRWIP